MENDGDMRRSVKEQLEAMGVDCQAIDARTWTQLERLEAALKDEETAFRKASLEAARHDFSISRMAKASAISRATFYNKPVLAAYVTRRRPERPRAVEEEMARLAARADDAERKVEQMMIRDGELIVAEAEIRRLKARVAALEKMVRLGVAAGPADGFSASRGTRRGAKD